MSKELDTTFYRFQSEVRAFLAKLLKNPVDAQPSKYLKDRDFTRKKLINELLSRDVIERHEKILDRTNSEEKEAKYVVKFKIHKKDFEKRLHRMYIKFFEKNLNESVEEMQAYHGSGNKFRRFKEKHSTYYGGWGTYVSTLPAVGKHYAGINGYVYEVNIPDDNGRNYLHLYEVTPENCQLVQSILTKAFPNYPNAINSALERSKYVGNFSPIFNDSGIEGLPSNITPKDISKLFLKNGVIGLDMKRDFLLFDARMVKITKRTPVQKMVAEEADLSSCANLIGVVGGGKPGDTADRWAKYVNDNENGYKPSIFKDEEEMKKKILNGPDGDVYKKRGGIKLDEDGEGGGMAAVAGEGGDGKLGGTSSFSVGQETSRGDIGYDVPYGEVQRRGIYAGAQGEKRSKNPILGKTITAESKKGRRIYITEEQFERILKEEGLGGATTTFSVPDTTRGDLAYDAPGMKKSEFLEPALDRTPGGICINQMDDETKKRK